MHRFAYAIVAALVAGCAVAPSHGEGFDADLYDDKLLDEERLICSAQLLECEASNGEDLDSPPLDIECWTAYDECIRQALQDLSEGCIALIETCESEGLELEECSGWQGECAELSCTLACMDSVAEECVDACTQTCDDNGQPGLDVACPAA